MKTKVELNAELVRLREWRALAECKIYDLLVELRDAKEEIERLRTESDVLRPQAEMFKDCAKECHNELQAAVGTEPCPP